MADVHGSQLSRRTALAGATGVVGVASLAACSPSAGQAGSGDIGATTTVTLSDIPVGGAVSRTVADQPILIAQPKAGTVVAFSAICTHRGCVVQPTNGEYDCPCHGSRFNETTGDVIQGPARQPLKKLSVKVEGDSVTVSV
jgi:Rieske Fe-S protein